MERIIINETEDIEEVEATLDEAGCDYDYDSGDRMIIGNDGLKALDEAGIDYDIV